ncbi:uncharacterized protein [Mytilus edulis]|uniref:uncharacterized protein n=1 Tax=Mytilus edulis TaxID=6550 RepID=UPI0039EE9904
MRLKIDDWEKESTNFIRTRAYEEVLKQIDLHSCVVVTGSSGSGKSSIVRRVSVSLCKEKSYEMILISEPNELKKNYYPRRKTVFVLEDLCGKFTADVGKIRSWYSKATDVMEQINKDDACKILFSCRLQVYNDTKFSLLQSFKLYECNIISENICLNKDEKKKIFKSYLGSETITECILSRTIENFPLICKQFSFKKTDHDIEKYFQTPYDAYETELKYLKTHAEKKFCGLCLCIIFNNQLKEEYFITLLPKFKQTVADTCENIGIATFIPAASIREELDNVDKTYVNKHNGIYEICHDNLFDFMACYMGNLFPKCFIDHADSGFLRERFLWKGAIESDKRILENIVYFESCLLPFYIGRMILDWEEGKVLDVFYNINMTSESFRKMFLERLEGIGENKASTLAKIKNWAIDDFASGDTPLIVSALHGYVDLMKWLIDNQADVDEQREDGASALCMACEESHVKAVKILIENKADANLCKKEGSSPLDIACFFGIDGDTNIISELLQGKANVNYQNETKKNMTPLFMAVQRNFYDAASLLLEHGADHRICLSNGMSVLLVACQKNYIEIVRLLLEKKADPNIEKNDGNTPLFSASAMGFKDITELLLAEGADINKCLPSKEEITKDLEESPKALRRIKQSWVKIARSFGSRKTYDYIKRKGKNNITDYLFDVVAGSSPLHIACFMGHFEIIFSFLTNDQLLVDPRKQNGITPLYYACEIGHLKIIQVLLDNKADPNSCKDNQFTPLQIAKINKHDDVLSLLASQTSKLL